MKNVVMVARCWGRGAFCADGDVERRGVVIWGGKVCVRVEVVSVIFVRGVTESFGKLSFFRHCI